jgi:nucleoside phosphorylase
MILTGAGRAQTEKAMAWLLETERPDSILSLGFARACTPNLDIGDLVLATRLNHIEGSPFDWDPQSGESQLDVRHEELLVDGKMLDIARGAVEINGIDFMPSPTLTVNSLVRTSGLSAWLGATYGVSAVDRESYWVAAAAAGAGVPCLSVRSIVYGVDETLPEVASRLPDTPSGGRFGPIFKYGVRHPREMWRYMRAVRSARNAVATLTAVLTNTDVFNVGINP